MLLKRYNLWRLPNPWLHQINGSLISQLSSWHDAHCFLDSKWPKQWSRFQYGHMDIWVYGYKKDPSLIYTNIIYTNVNTMMRVKLWCVNIFLYIIVYKFLYKKIMRRTTGAKNNKFVNFLFFPLFYFLSTHVITRICIKEYWN